MPASFQILKFGVIVHMCKVDGVQTGPIAGNLTALHNEEAIILCSAKIQNF